eukprot:2788917-Rhodomonas_salina.3
MLGRYILSVAKPCPVLTKAASGIVLCTRYAMSSTDLGCLISSYALATQCPVLTSAVLLPGGSHAQGAKPRDGSTPLSSYADPTILPRA